MRKELLSEMDKNTRMAFLDLEKQIVDSRTSLYEAIENKHPDKYNDVELRNRVEKLESKISRNNIDTDNITEKIISVIDKQQKLDIGYQLIKDLLRTNHIFNVKLFEAVSNNMIGNDICEKVFLRKIYLISTTKIMAILGVNDEDGQKVVDSLKNNTIDLINNSKCLICENTDSCLSINTGLYDRLDEPINSFDMMSDGRQVKIFNLSFKKKGE